MQLLRKFIDDNRGHSEFSRDTSLAGFSSLSADCEMFGSRRLQNRALLEKVASLEKSAIQILNFQLNLPTPAEYIVVFLQMFESKVS